MRQRRSLASTPYPKSRASRRPIGQEPAPNGQQQVPVALWPLCPRRGIDWVASSNQPQAAWEVMAKPHEVISTSLANFMFTLTSHDVRDAILLLAHSAFSSQETTVENESQTLWQMARICKETNRTKASFDFKSMIALMRLAFKCARYAVYK